MMKRTVFVLAAAAALALPATFGLAVVSPAGAQASLNIGLSVPGPAPVYEPVPVGGPVYAWGGGYRDWDHGRDWNHWDHGWRGREHRHWREERWEHRHFYDDHHRW